MPKRASAPSPDEATALAFSALAFLAEDAQRLSRFLALTGIGPEVLRGVAESPDIQLGVLDHVLADESLLLVFTASKGLEPATISTARQILARAHGVAPHQE